MQENGLYGLGLILYKTGMKRIYSEIIEEHLHSNRQMIFIAGPRQVGKTTVARLVQGERGCYVNWDNLADRKILLKGPDAMATHCGLSLLREESVLIVFDEIHKYAKWKSFLKGFFDIYGDQCKILVTGSARLDVYKKGGDSLLGRYFLYRMHPQSVAEIFEPVLLETEIRKPGSIPQDKLDTLLQYSGFPEPYLANNRRFYNRWQRMRLDLLFREELRDLTRIQEVGQVQVLAKILQYQASQSVNYSNLANEINVSVDTVCRWIATLESLYYCFSVRPWFRNIPKSLRKQPKIFLWDWSGIKNDGARHENFVASHLLKAVHWWTDIGLGEYHLYYLRDKEKREVDFLVTRDDIPWFLVEVKTSGKQSLNKNLFYFQKKTGAQHAFQVAFDLEFIAQDCFSVKKPVIVPATTFLSQLV